MAHARVVLYNFKEGTASQVAEKAEREVLPLFQKQPGFHSYTLIRGHGDKIISVSVWESRTDAEVGNRASSAWVQENLSRVLLSVERYYGDVAFSFPELPGEQGHMPSD